MQSFRKMGISSASISAGLPIYTFFEISDGKVLNREQRDKLSHALFVGETHSDHEQHDHAQPHGFNPAAQFRHAQMANAIADCNTLLAGGMGNGAYESLKAAHFKPIITDIVNIEEAIQAFIDETIIDHQERLH